MKIKINQEENTSPKLDALLKLDRQQQHLKIRWIILPILIVLLMFSWQQHLFTAWVILPSIWMLLVFNHLLIIRSRRQKLQKIQEIKLDPVFMRSLQQRYPHISLKQRRLIEAGFKDYLALHAIQQQAYAMPSNAVDALWHEMLEYPDQYRKLCIQTIGRELNHHPYGDETQAEQQAKQLFEAWKYSCMLHGYDPRNTTQMPRLFAIDQALNWEHGQHFDLDKMTKDYAKYLQEQSSSSSSCGSSCSSCGGD